MQTPQHYATTSNAEPVLPCTATTVVGTFVALGSSNKYRFERLVAAVLTICEDLPKPVLIQGIQVPVAELPASVAAVEFIGHEQYQALLGSARLVICHAGAGTMLAALRAGAPVIAMARLGELREAADDHQLELAREFSSLGLIKVARDAQELRQAAFELQDSVRLASWSTRSQALVETVAEKLRPSECADRPLKIALVASSGGHLTELRELARAYDKYEHFFVVSKFVGESPEMNNRTSVFPTEERDWRVLITGFQVLRLFRRERPDIVLSTGSGSALPAIVLGKLLFGTQVIFVESIARVRFPSPAGRVAYLFADHFIYQWPLLARFFPDGQLVGRFSVSPSSARVGRKRRPKNAAVQLFQLNLRRLSRWFRTSSASRRESESPSST